MKLVCTTFMLVTISLVAAVSAQEQSAMTFEEMHPECAKKSEGEGEVNYECILKQLEYPLEYLESLSPEERERVERRMGLDAPIDPAHIITEEELAHFRGLDTFGKKKEYIEEQEKKGRSPLVIARLRHIAIHDKSLGGKYRGLVRFVRTLALYDVNPFVGLAIFFGLLAIFFKFIAWLSNK